MGHAERAEDPRFCGPTRHDLLRGTCQTHHEGRMRWWSDAPFAPRNGSTEADDGHLVNFVWDGDARQSKVCVFDAKDISNGPVCRITLPQRVPNGFHATGVSAERLARGW